MNGSTLRYCRSGGTPLVIGNQAGMEAQGVRDDERGQAEQRVREDVEDDEQAIVPVHHGRPSSRADPA